jgi:hypothetical protein
MLAHLGDLETTMTTSQPQKLPPGTTWARAAARPRVVAAEQDLDYEWALIRPR